jgi:2-dehydropantoate 2-reductase
MKILIYGSGAIGSNIGGLLTKHGENVTLLARGAQLEALRSQGLIVERKNYPVEKIAVKAVSAEECEEKFDVIFVTLKSTQLQFSATDIVSKLAKNGSLVMIQNGLPWWYFDGLDSQYSGLSMHSLDPGGILKKTLPLDCIIGGVIYMPVSQLAPGHIYLHDIAVPKLLIGELNGVLSSRLQNLKRLVNDSGLMTEAVQDIRKEKWLKLSINLIWNSLCAITQSAPGYVSENIFVADLVRDMIRELDSVAQSLQVTLELDAEKELQRVHGNYAQQPSMLQDVRAGKMLESDAIVGAVIEIAEITGVKIPALRIIGGLLGVINQTIIREKKGIVLI